MTDSEYPVISTMDDPTAVTDYIREMNMRHYADSTDLVPVTIRSTGWKASGLTIDQWFFFSEAHRFFYEAYINSAQDGFETYAMRDAYDTDEYDDIQDETIRKMEWFNMMADLTDISVEETFLVRRNNTNSKGA